MRPLCGLLGVSVALMAGPAAGTAADLGAGAQSLGRGAAASTYEAGVYDWNGFYGGAQVGYGWGSSDAEGQWGNITNQPETFSYHMDGALGGLHVGYNIHNGFMLFGVETDFEISDLSGSGNGSGNAIHSAEIDWGGSLRARIGITSMENQLIYVTGGLAYANISLSQREKDKLVDFSQDQQVKTGWTIGAGIEQALSPGMTARIEYRYTDLGETTYYDPAMKMRDTTDLQVHSVRAAISMKF